MDSLKGNVSKTIPIDAALVNDVIVSSPEEAERIGLNHSTVQDIADGKYGASPALQQLARRALENLRKHGIKA